MIVELTGAGSMVETERPIAVYYEDRVAGKVSADLVVNGSVIVELKAKEKLVPAHEAQLVNYLRATEIEIGLLFNFGKTPEFKRKFFANINKAIPHREPTGAFENLFYKDPFESA
jgi:GxxExxY protein